MIRRIAGAVRPPDGPYDADVIILALDRPEETVAAIRSALAQTGVSRHVTVLDQGSMAENLVCLEMAVAGRPDATLLRSDRNLGVAEGRNRASAYGHGRAIVGLDNDAVFATPDTLAGLVAALDRTSNLGAVDLCRAGGATRLALFHHEPTYSDEDIARRPGAIRARCCRMQRSGS